MSGYCLDCGNDLCVCKEIEADKKSKSFFATDPNTHQSENTWFTPKEFFEKIDGAFDLDPCTMSFRPYNIAKINIEHDRGEDGLKVKWGGFRCFINPPYGKEIAPFIEKFIKEKPDGMMLIFARMGSQPVQDLINSGAYLYLLRKRVKFKRKDGSHNGSAGTDSMLVFFNYDEFFKIDHDGVLIQKST